jgi:RNA polymerase sigma-70 factor (ECF subfamily)
MTTLPELDSELGVLKFLKWKTRLLALDVIRANSRVSIAPLHEQREFEADIPEIGQELERADDAAIVSLALAKLQPRHREALIATLYEEKSAEVVSAQMGLGENAFRQLLFRSRAAFKKALIGEAEISGLSMSEVLSVAARKAAAESGKLASVAGAFLLVLALSFGVIPNLTSNVSEENISLPQPAVAESQVTELSPGEDSLGISEEEPEYLGEITPLESSDGGKVADEVEVEVVAGATVNAASPKRLVAKPPEMTPATADTPEKGIILAGLRNTLGASAAMQLASTGGSTAALDKSGPKGTLSIITGSGLTGIISYDLESDAGIQRVWFEISIDGESFISAPMAWFAKKTENTDGTLQLDYAATDLLIGDTSGNYDFIAIGDSVLSRSAIQISLLFGKGGAALDSSMFLNTRS